MAYVDKKELYKLFEESNGIIKLHVSDVDMLPTADVVEVKHGKWIESQYISKRLGIPVKNEIFFTCSECGKDSIGKSKYCRECGALMDGGV